MIQLLMKFHVRLASDEILLFSNVWVLVFCLTVNKYRFYFQSRHEFWKNRKRNCADVRLRKISVQKRDKKNIKRIPKNLESCNIFSDGAHEINYMP